MMTETLSKPTDRFTLRDRRVLYTGAAGGLGSSTTHAMLRDGAHEMETGGVRQLSQFRNLFSLRKQVTIFGAQGICFISVAIRVGGKCAAP